MYCAALYASNKKRPLASAENRTLPDAVKIAALLVVDFDSVQRVRREIHRAGVYARGFKSNDGRACYVVIKPAAPTS